MEMMGKSTLPKAPELEPHHQMVLCHIQETRFRVLPLRRNAVGVFYTLTRLDENWQKDICSNWINPVISKSKDGDRSRGQPEGSLFNGYYTEAWGRATPFLGLLHFILDTYLIILSIKQRDIKYRFLSLWIECLSFRYSVRQWPGIPRLNPLSSHTKDSKMALYI